MGYVVVVVVVVVLIALVVQLPRGSLVDVSWFERTGPSRHESGLEPPMPARAAERAAPVQSPSVEHQPKPVSPGAGLDRSTNSVLIPAGPVPSADPRGPTQVDGSGLPNNVAAGAGTTDPNSVVGRPFPVSASVAAGCKVYTCPEMDEVLARFAQEPRDSAWAAQMEAKLQDYVESQPGQYQIRAIECRTTLCFIEVASPYGSFGLPPYNYPLEKWLYPSAPEPGFEHDVNSGKITVTLMPFVRPPR